MICVAVLRGASINDLLSSLFEFFILKSFGRQEFICWREGIQKFVQITQMFQFLFLNENNFCIISFENRSFHPILKLGMRFYPLYITIKPSHNTFECMCIKNFRKVLILLKILFVTFYNKLMIGVFRNQFNNRKTRIFNIFDIFCLVNTPDFVYQWTKLSNSAYVLDLWLTVTIVGLFQMR